jgi:hypothetical protein
VPAPPRCQYRKRKASGRNRIVRGWRKPRLDDVAAQVDLDVVNVNYHVAVTPVACPSAWCARRAFEIIVAMDGFALPLAPLRLSTHRQ